MNQRYPKFMIILSLVIAGEMIFSLPFHVVRYFRPTLLDIFNISNTKLGDAIAIYGITAMLSYFPSGIIADRFSARKLMSLSLCLTALGGIYFALIPNQVGLSVLFGYWGITTILFFWSAMIRTTREWGGKLSQGKAFGFLDGGRGLAGAIAATFAVYFLAKLLPDVDNISSIQRTNAMKTVIYFYSLLTFATAILVWFFIPDSKKSNLSSSPFKGIVNVLKSRKAWLQSIIVVCAYCGYRGIDYYAIYAIDILGMNEVSTAKFVSFSTYLRPIAAISAGFLADKFTTRKVIRATFGVLILAYVLLVFLTSNGNIINVVFINLVFTIVAVYALRGVYFALFEETNVPGALTGTTAGLVSLVGFTPDIFFNSIAGRIIDQSPGLKGYNNFYLLLGLFALVGLSAAWFLTLKKPTN